MRRSHGLRSFEDVGREFGRTMVVEGHEGLAETGVDAVDDVGGTAVEAAIGLGPVVELQDNLGTRVDFDVGPGDGVSVGNGVDGVGAGHGLDSE